MLLGLLLERDGTEDARAVDEDVDAAEALDRRDHERLRLLAGGDLARHDQRALAGGIEVGLDGLELVAARAAEDDVGALLEEALGGRAADAAGPAGDEDGLVGEKVHVHQYTCIDT